MSVAIIDCGSGNLHSVRKAFEQQAGPLGREVHVTTDVKKVQAASHIVLPGVGAFADCMQGLEALGDMVACLEEEVRQRGKYFLGICVGMQMLLEEGLEHGSHAGLGWIKGKVVPIKPSDASLKIPHMGWNELILEQPAHKLFSGVKTGDHVYFVHSYHAECQNEGDILARTDYAQPVCAAIGRDNVMGVQFHPEKSQQAGLTMIGNFLRM